MKKYAATTCALFAFFRPAFAERPPLLPERSMTALAGELSGEAAKHNLEYVARLHRMRGSGGYRSAAQHIASQARAYGLEEVRVEQLPADGVTLYGTQKARQAWDAEFAELWELRNEQDQWVPVTRLASWEGMPVSLAQDSESADVTADLVDVGEGVSESDYAGKDVRGKIVLASAQPGPVARLAVARYGAAGIVSYAQNQRTAWWGENENLVRWGHLDSFDPTRTFGFMLSLKQARSYREQLARGERIRLHAIVRAGRHAGSYDIVTGVVSGADPRLRDEEVVFTCHLDHQRTGANYNASGSVTILEVARALVKLVSEGKLARPARTMRFIWSPEIEGTMALLSARPEWVPRIRAVVHMDMVGGGPETKAIFHVTRGPASLPSFIHDIAETFAEFVNRETAQFAGTGGGAFPLTSPEGGSEPLRVEFAEFTSGSDHQVYAEGSFRIPAIYLNDWPDRYIHTNADLPGNIDSTKLKRAAFIGATSGYFLANLGPGSVADIWPILQCNILRRTATMLHRRAELPAEEAANLTRCHFRYERSVADSISRFVPLPADFRNAADQFFGSLERVVGGVLVPAPATGDGALVFRRNPDIKGPMSTFGYDFFADHFGAERAGKISLLKFHGLRGEGAEYAYEVLNFVDGARSAREICREVSAEYGPIPLDLVLEYLRALQSIGALKLTQ